MTPAQTRDALSRAVEILSMRAQYMRTNQPREETARLASRAHALLKSAANGKQSLYERGEAWEAVAPRHGVALSLMLYAMDNHPKHFGITKETT